MTKSKAQIEKRMKLVSEKRTQKENARQKKEDAANKQLDGLSLDELRNLAIGK